MVITIYMVINYKRNGAYRDTCPFILILIKYNKTMINISNIIKIFNWQIWRRYIKININIIYMVGSNL